MLDVVADQEGLDGGDLHGTAVADLASIKGLEASRETTVGATHSASLGCILRRFGSLLCVGGTGDRQPQATQKISSLHWLHELQSAVVYTNTGPICAGLE